MRAFLFPCYVREYRETRQARKLLIHKISEWISNGFGLMTYSFWMTIQWLIIDIPLLSSPLAMYVFILIILADLLLLTIPFLPPYPGQYYYIFSINYTFHLHFDSRSLCPLPVWHLVGAPTIQHKYGALVAYHHPRTIGNDGLLSAYIYIIGSVAFVAEFVPLLYFAAICRRVTWLISFTSYSAFGLA